MSSERYIKSKVGAAFGLVIALMITIVLINAAYLNNSSEHLGRVVGVHNTQMLMMNQMLDLSRRRSLTLQHMLMDDDRAHLDDQLRKMDVINSEYVNLRDKLHDLTYTLEEIDLLKKQSALTMNTGVIQGRVIEMLVEGDSAGAIKLFHEQAIPSVSSSMELMNEFVALQSKHDNLEMKANRDGVMMEIKLSLLLLGIGVLLSIFIALWVVARLRRENDRRNQIEEELEERMAERSREVVALSVQSTEARMQTLFDISPEFIFIIDTEGVILKTNQYACDNSGYSMDEIVGKRIWDFFTEDSKMVCDCNFPKLRKSGNSRADIEFVCKDQRVINMECTAIVVPDQKGDLKNFMMMQRDVTQSRKSASALVESEKRFRTLFDSTFQFISVLDSDGIVLEANRTLLEFLDCEATELVGKLFSQSLAMGNVENNMQPMHDAIVRANLGDLVHLELDLKRRDGLDVTVDLTLKSVMNEEKQPCLIIVEGRDITERKKTEEEAKQHLRESAHFLRLSAMGEMASGMAHELNQPLLAIGSYCESAHAMISEIPDAPEALKDIVNRATEQALRADEIIRHMRGFIGKEDGVREAIDIDELMFKIVKFVNWEIQNSGIEIDLIKGGNGHRVMANKIQIEQVVINLVMNSIEAIQGEEIDKAKLVLQTQLKHGDSIEMTVTDNGPGMDPGIIKMAFDPFQTSKKSGMGLGLSISRSIIETHGGKLWVDEQYKDGARFGFELPVVEPGDEH